MDGYARFQKRQCFSGNVFKFGGDGGTLSAHFAQRVLVKIIGLKVTVGECASRAVGAGIKYPDPVTHGAGCDTEHTSQLPAAEHTKNGIRADHGLGGSSMFSAMSRCAVRKSSSCCASLSSCSASKLIA